MVQQPRIRNIFIAIPFLLAIADVSPANGQTNTAPAPLPTPRPPIVTRLLVRVNDNSLVPVECNGEPECSDGFRPVKSDDVIGLNSMVRLKIENLVEYSGDASTSGKIILYLNGRPMKSNIGVLVQDGNQVEFKLTRTKDSLENWNLFLGSPRFGESRTPIRIGAGWEAGPEFKLQGITTTSVSTQVTGNTTTQRSKTETKQRIVKTTVVTTDKITKKTTVRQTKNLIPNLSLTTVDLRVYDSEGFWTAAGTLVLVLVLVGAAIYNTEILRDPCPRNLPPKMRPYSLAKVQVAYWTVLIFGSFIFINIITGDWGGLTSQALTIMGISGGTTVLAKLIDVDKDKCEQHPPSENWFKDIISDENGVAFHRLQIFCWDIIMGVMFIQGVYRNLAMPEFSPEMLALLGISSGTYLGLKIPENQTAAANSSSSSSSGSSDSSLSSPSSLAGTAVSSSSSLSSESASSLSSLSGALERGQENYQGPGSTHTQPEG